MTEGIPIQEDDESISSLAAWAVQHGATLHPKIEVHRDEVTGLSFRVKPSLDSDDGIEAGTEVVKCPTNITLSYLNALEQTPDGFHNQTGGSPLPPLFVNQSPPHVVGRVLLMREYLLREKSFWWPYIRTLPQPIRSSGWMLPPVWPSGDREYLEGTNLERAIEEARDSLKREYGEVTRLLKDMANAHEYTRNLYDWAYCIFSSRSFTPSLVIPEAQRIQLPVDRKLNDFSLLLPLLDIGNHAITSKYAWVLDSKERTCNFVTHNSYLPGEQVFNNYGLKTNGALLMGYGFMIPETDSVHNDYIHLRKRAGPASPGSTPPIEFFMSLRPMRDSSSVLGKAVQTISMLDEPVHPAFGHVQDGLIWDIVVAQTTSEQRSALFPTNVEFSDEDRELEQLRQFLTGKVSEAAQPLLEQTMAVIYNKALQELERLNETEYEPPSSDETSHRIQVALEYRSQCRKTLEAVLESIQSSFPSEDEE